MASLISELHYHRSVEAGRITLTDGLAPLRASPSARPHALKNARRLRGERHPRTEPAYVGIRTYPMAGRLGRLLPLSKAPFEPGDQRFVRRLPAGGADSDGRFWFRAGWWVSVAGPVDQGASDSGLELGGVSLHTRR
jgi:hypothetical protein